MAGCFLAGLHDELHVQYLGCVRRRPGVDDIPKGRTCLNIWITELFSLLRPQQNNQTNRRQTKTKRQQRVPIGHALQNQDTNHVCLTNAFPCATWLCIRNGNCFCFCSRPQKNENDQTTLPSVFLESTWISQARRHDDDPDTVHYGNVIFFTTSTQHAQSSTKYPDVCCHALAYPNCSFVRSWSKNLSLTMCAKSDRRVTFRPPSSRPNCVAFVDLFVTWVYAKCYVTLCFAYSVRA